MTGGTHRPLPYRLLPVLRADNAEVVIHPDDRKLGALLVGSQGSGKCIGPDDLVLLAGRLIRAEDAWHVYSTTAVHDGLGWWSPPLEQPLTCAVDADGRIVARPVTRLYRQRVDELVRRIRLSDGSELTLTRAHQLRGPDGWTADLSEGDIVCAPRHVDWAGRPVDLEIVELLAWQIAEGCETSGANRSSRGSSVVMITQGDIAVLERLRDLFLRVGERYGLRVHDPVIDPDNNAARLTVQSADWRDFLKQRGYRWGQRSRDKAIPDFIMQGDLDAARVFLRAYADAEGSVRLQQRTIEFMTASRVLGEQVRLLLRRFGIVASFRLKRASATNGHRIVRDYRRISIFGDSTRLFLEHIGFGYERKRDRLAAMVTTSRPHAGRFGVYTRDILREAKDLGVPFAWICHHTNYLETPRAGREIAAGFARNLVAAADRIDRGDLVTAGARGSAALRARLPLIAAVDTEQLRALAAKLERRIRAEVLYLTVERIEEVHHDGWVYDFEVPDEHNYVAGGMLAHNTAALVRMYLNDLRDERSAPIVLDPKSELARLCLRLTPPDCGKRVWFLDLGHPAFGMSPIRVPGEGPLATEAAAIADNVVAALLDINANQIFQSSRRYLYHAVIGAIAYAQRQERRPRLEDVYTLLRPAKDDFRAAVAEACADRADLDQTAEFFRSELPDDLRLATSRVAERLDAPRNKISGLTGVPPLRRFFNHPTDVALSEIIEARDILIVDANMGAIGAENARACMHFVLRMLHTQLQRQVHRPETDRPRVPLIVDEAHYIAGAENVVDQIATHRAAGLETAFGLQYFAQLGSGSDHEEKIRKGVLNLLQSRFLFRVGDAQDAEEATRIAMSVYATMIRDDPDSRARLRVTPEQALNFPNHHCLASWIAAGSRIPSFMGRTYAWPAVGDEWARHHLDAMAERVGPYPDELAPTLDRAAPHSGSADEPHAAEVPGGLPAKARRTKLEEPRPKASAEASVSPGRSRRPTIAPGNLSNPAAATDGKREVRVDIEPPPPAPDLRGQGARRVVGRPLTEPPPEDTAAPAPDSLRELAFLDRINEIGEPQHEEPAERLPRLYDADYAILALLDRAGLVPRVLIARAVLPDRGPSAIADRLAKLYRAGVIARHSAGLRQRERSDGKPPLLYSLTRYGMAVAQARHPSPAISQRREWRALDQQRAARLGHDLHALGWAIAFHRAVGSLATDNWRTPRYATGRYPVPQLGSGQRRHPITLNEIPVADGQAIIDVAQKPFTEIKPDLSLELRIDALELTFDLLVEVDLTGRPSYNREKFLAYDAFLTGWNLAHPRYRAQGTRPIVLFVCRDAHTVLACAREADEALTGRIGIMGSPAEHWYYAGRDHVLFADEADLHHGRLAALALPPLPPGLRHRLTGDRQFNLERVTLLPNTVIAAAGRSV